MKLPKLTKTQKILQAIVTSGVFMWCAIFSAFVPVINIILVPAFLLAAVAGPILGFINYRELERKMA